MNRWALVQSAQNSLHKYLLCDMTTTVSNNFLPIISNGGSEGRHESCWVWSVDRRMWTRYGSSLCSSMGPVSD